jgi:ribosomal-protein-alanine acetyltransferase
VDVGELAALEAACFGAAAWTQATLGEFLAREDAVVALLYVGPTAAGYTIGWSNAGAGELLRIAVHPDARAEGHGKRLLVDWHQRVDATGCNEAWLEVRASNTAALALYRGTGWSETGRRPRYYSDGEEAVLMSRLA